MLAVICTIFALVVSWLAQDHLRGIRRNGLRLNRPPGTLPLAGYGIWFLRPRHVLLEWLASIQPQMGFETFELLVPSLPPAVLVNDPLILEQILLDTTTFVKGKFFKSRTQDLFRDGILNADGDLWRIQRKAGLRFLSTRNLEVFVNSDLAPLLDETVASLTLSASTGRVVDMQKLFLELTTRFMGKIAYDMDITNEMPFAQAFQHASTEIGYRFTNPLWRLKDILAGHSLRAAVAVVRNFGTSIVDEAMRQKGKQAKDNLPEDRDDLRQIPYNNLIGSLIKYIPSSDTVAAAAVNYLSAGRDTTAQALAWALYHLLRNPEKLMKLRESLLLAGVQEVSMNYAEAKSDQRFAYLRAVFSEALRLSPPIPLEIKESTRKTVLRDGTVLPAGAVLIWSPYAMARNPKIWGEDAAMFRPERWLVGLSQARLDTSDGEYDSHLKTPFENPVFNGGPRACIGKHLAEILATVVISRVVLAFKFEAPQTQQHQTWQAVGQDGLTMSIKDGLHVIVKRA